MSFLQARHFILVIYTESFLQYWRKSSIVVIIKYYSAKGKKKIGGCEGKIGLRKSSPLLQFVRRTTPSFTPATSAVTPRIASSPRERAVDNTISKTERGDVTPAFKGGEKRFFLTNSSLFFFQKRFSFLL